MLTTGLMSATLTYTCNNLRLIPTNTIQASASRWEQFIGKYLKRHNFNFTHEYDIPTKWGGFWLSFDFAVFFVTGLHLIEYQGKHHFEPIFGTAKLKQTQRQDRLKVEYCKKTNTPFLVLPYWLKRREKRFELDKFTGIK
jgi:hypothetical protein